MSGSPARTGSHIGPGNTCERRGCRRNAVRRITIYRAGTIPDWVDVCTACLQRPDVQALMVPPQSASWLAAEPPPSADEAPPRRVVLPFPTATPQENPMPKPLPPPREPRVRGACNVTDCIMAPTSLGLCDQHHVRIRKDGRLDEYADAPKRPGRGARVAQAARARSLQAVSWATEVLDIPAVQRCTEGPPIMRDGVVVACGRPPVSPVAEMLDSDPPALTCDRPSHPVEYLVEGEPVTEMGASAASDGLGTRIVGGKVRRPVSLEDAGEALLQEEVLLRRRVRAYHQLRLLPRVDGIQEIRLTLVGEGWSDTVTLGAGPADTSLPLVYAAVRSAVEASVLEVRRQLVDAAFPGQWVVDEEVASG